MLDYDMIGSPNYVRFVYDGDGIAVREPTSPRRPGGLRQRSRRSKRTGSVRSGLTQRPRTFDGRSDYVGFIDTRNPRRRHLHRRRGRRRPSSRSGSTAAPRARQYDPCYHEICDNLMTILTGRSAAQRRRRWRSHPERDRCRLAGGSAQDARRRPTRLSRDGRGRVLRRVVLRPVEATRSARKPRKPHRGRHNERWHGHDHRSGGSTLFAGPAREPARRYAPRHGSCASSPAARPASGARPRRGWPRAAGPSTRPRAGRRRWPSWRPRAAGRSRSTSPTRRRCARPSTPSRAASACSSTTPATRSRARSRRCRWSRCGASSRRTSSGCCGCASSCCPGCGRPARARSSTSARWAGGSRSRAAAPTTRPSTPSRR